MSVTPKTLIGLANLGRPRRPAGATAPVVEAALPDAVTATSQLRGLIPRAAVDGDLPGLRRVREIAARAADALLRGDVPDPSALNRIARDSSAHTELVVDDDGAVRQELVWHDRSLAGHLARRVIDEIAALDRSRLRRCARNACDLLFYDTTRSRTRRWHAEDPCGCRERQRAHRAHD